MRKKSHEAKTVVYLLGCGKQKQKAGWVGEAKDLYTGSLFKAKKRFTERVNATWYIVSAKLGLVDPVEVVSQYDLTVGDLRDTDKSLWAMKLVSDLIRKLCCGSDPKTARYFTIHLHMGKEYADAIHTLLHIAGFSVILPVEGLGQGEQMKWYSEDRNIKGGYSVLDRSDSMDGESTDDELVQMDLWESAKCNVTNAVE